MKKSFSLVVLIAVAISFCLMSFLNSSTTAAPFEGIVDFDVVADAPDLPAETQAMMKNIQFRMLVKKEHYKSEMNMGLFKLSIFGSNKSSDEYMLYDMFGQQRLVKKTAEDVSKENTTVTPPVFKYLAEQKEIAGYKCKKAIMSVKVKDKEGKDVSQDVSIWYTEAISFYNLQRRFTGLKGFPLEFSHEQNNMQMRFVAKSVKVESVPDSTFTPPSDLKVESFQEFMQFARGFLGGAK